MLLVFPAFLVLALILYSPSFHGVFVSDDLAVINPYGAPLSVGKVISLFSPYGSATTLISEYRPLWFLFHAIERHAFGDSMVGYHVTNVGLHSVVSGLLVLLFVRFGLPSAWAVLGGAIFLVHPANVEAVAWISQLTSVAAMAFALSALLLVPKRQPAALACFGLALLTKPLASFALPVSGLRTYVERGNVSEGEQANRWWWFGGWILVFAVFLGIETIAAESANYDVPPMHPDPVVVWRTIIANFSRYLVMSATGYGLAAFQQARPALSWFNPWWLAGVAALVLLTWRAATTLLRRQHEGIFWVWVLAAFAPVSQVVAFTHPIADRYLYFILPGLIGGTLLVAHSRIEQLARIKRINALRIGAAAALAALVVFSFQTYQRAGLWVSVDRLSEDSRRHYPNGLWAHLYRSRLAAQAGDGQQSAMELRAAFELGHREWGVIVADPTYGPVLRHPAFKQVFIDMADWWIMRVHDIDEPNQMQLYQLASAYWLRGNFAESKKALERALALGGPFDDAIRSDLSTRFGQIGSSS
jgi:hypothetical protein